MIKRGKRNFGCFIGYKLTSYNSRGLFGSIDNQTGTVRHGSISTQIKQKS